MGDRSLARARVCPFSLAVAVDCAVQQSCWDWAEARVGWGSTGSNRRGDRCVYSSQLTAQWGVSVLQILPLFMSAAQVQRP